MEQKGLGLIVMAMAWQEVKEAIEYDAETTAQEVISSAARTAANDPVIQNELLPRLKQEAKQAIEYTVETADRELEALETGRRQTQAGSG